MLKQFIRLSSLLILLFCMFSSVSAIEYLNSCGKNSGWTNGETYILNFTEIPSAYANDYCFQITQDHENITFKGLNTTIDNQKTPDLLYFFEFFPSSSFTLTNFTIKDIYISEVSRFISIERDSSSDYDIFVSDFNINNINIEEVLQFIRVRTDGFIRGFFRNSELDNIILQEGSGFMSCQVQDGNPNPCNNNNISYSYFNVDFIFDGFDPPTNNYLNYISTTATQLDADGVFEGENTYNNSLLTLFPQNDSNNDGEGDTLINANAPNPRIWVETNNYNFFQDVEEGRGDGEFNFVNDKTLPYIFLSTNETFTAPEFVNFDDGNNISFPIANNFSTLNKLETFNIWDFQNTGIDCSILNIENKCYFDDSQSATTTGDEFRGMMWLYSGSYIKNTYMEQLKQNGSDQQMFSTPLTPTPSPQQNNLVINSNEFFKYDGDGGTENSFLGLYTTNLNMYDNVIKFDSIGDPANVYNFMNIRSTTLSSNKIYNNTFTNEGTSPTIPHKIFDLNCDTKFYNNYIGENVTLLDYNCGSEFNATSLVAYEHTNDNIYYFEIGNYYEENTACTDANSDDICDSSYSGSVYTDEKPLASYPFDFASNIMNADIVIDNTTFNINILNPQDNQTLNIEGSTSTIDLSFTQDSDFPDLKCDFVLDGAVVDSEFNTAKSTTITSSLTSWTEKEYSFRVECYNDVVFQQSNEITFVVNFGTGGNGGDEEPPTPEELGLGIFNPTNLFGDDPTQSTNEIKNIMIYVSQGYGFLVLIGFMALILGLIMLILALPYLLNPNK